MGSGLTKYKTLLVKREQLYGVDSLPVATDAVNVFDLKVDVETEKLEHMPVGGSMSPVAHSVGQRWVKVTCSTHNRGGGSAGDVPEQAALLRASRHTEIIDPGVDVRYTPASARAGVENVVITAGGTGYADGTLVFTGGGGTGAAGTYTQTAGVIDAIIITNKGTGYTSAPNVEPSDAGNSDANLNSVMGTVGFESCTIYAYIDGAVHKIPGCRGTMELVIDHNQLVKYNFTFDGLFTEPDDNLLLTGVEVTTRSVKASLANFKINGYAAAARNVTLANNNSISKLQEFNEIGRVEITDGAPTASIGVDAVARSTHDYWADVTNETLQTFEIQVGTVAGNIMKLTMPKLQFDNIVWGDKEGTLQYDIPGVPTGDAGDDEYELLFE